MGANVHLWLTSSTEDQFGMDKLILLSFDPAVWPPASLSPVAMDVGQSSKDGLVVDPGWGRVFVSSTGSNLVTVAQDGAALCSTPLAPSGGELVAVVETH